MLSNILVLLIGTVGSIGSWASCFARQRPLEALYWLVGFIFRSPKAFRSTLLARGLHVPLAKGL